MKREVGQFTKKLGLKIKFERTKQNLSQTQLAELANMSNNALSNIENAISSPSVETVNSIAEALAIPIYELINVEKLEL